MPAIPIRPRRATELVDASFQLLRGFYPQLLTVTAIAMSPLVFARVLWSNVLTDPKFMVAHPAALGIGYVVILACTMLADGVLIVAISNGYLDGIVDLAMAFTTAARRLPGIVGASIWRGVVIMGPLVIVAMLAGALAAMHAVWPMFLLVPAAMAFASVAFIATFATLPALLLEQLGPRAALNRSWRLTKLYRTHAFWTLLLSYMLYLVLYTIASVLGMTAFNVAIAAVFGTVIVVLVYPFLAVVQTLLYYDLRVRKEGFDLEVMSRQLGGGDTAASPLPAA